MGAQSNKTKQLFPKSVTSVFAHTVTGYQYLTDFERSVIDETYHERCSDGIWISSLPVSRYRTIILRVYPEYRFSDKTFSDVKTKLN